MIAALMTRYYDTIRSLGQTMRSAGKKMEAWSESKRDVWRSAIENYRGPYS